MAMNYAWQERKKFAIPVGAGALAILIWYFIVLSPINAATDRAVRDRKALESQLRLRMQSGVPTDEAVGRAERDKGTFQKDLKDIQDKLAFRVDDTFKARDGGSARKFGQLRHEIATKIDTIRTQKGMETGIDMQLRFPKGFESVPEPVMAEWLIRLAMVQRVCMLSLESGVAGLSLVETVPDENQVEPTIPNDKFLGVLTVKFKVTGPAESILRIAHGLQTEGATFLSLQAMDVTSADPQRNHLGATITAAALIVRPDGALVVETKP